MPTNATDILDCTLEQFLRRFPSAGHLLESVGLFAPADDATADPLDAYLTLRSRLRQRGEDAEAFLGRLATLDGKPGEAARPLWIEANIPCALKAPLEIALARAAAAAVGEAGPAPHLTVQSENESSIANQGATIPGLAAMPVLTKAAGYNTLLDHAFMNRLATPEHFAARPGREVHPALAPHGFADPAGVYRVVGVNVFVFVADPSRAEGRDAPDTWERLLAADYARDVAVCGMGDAVSGSLLLHVQARFGDEAVRRLGRNVRCGMHPSQVIKRLGTGDPQSPAVAVMPYFFAKLADIRRPARVLWPGDGAVAMPFFQLVKRRGPEGLDRFAAYLEGPEVGRICSGAAFPSLHPDVPCPLPGEARLTWLGWDYIRDNDLAALRERAASLFEAGRAESRP